MAKGINRVQLLGNVGRDPEMQSTRGGALVSKFSLATVLPLSEITTLYLPIGQAFGLDTLNVVTAGPSVAMDSVVLLNGWSLPSS